jgi:hypothetical protein
VTSPAWTHADQAELDVLVHAFVDGFYEHRARCTFCAAGGPWCDSARDAFEAVVSWRRFRELRSRAEWLRRSFDELALILDGRDEKAAA